LSTEIAETERWVCEKCQAIFRIGFTCCPADGGLLQPFADDPMVGRTVANRYVIEACVGEGAMGRVYRARHHRLSRLFAIKLLFGDLAADPTMQTRFQREAEAASRLSHPNIVSVVDFGEHDGLLYIAMEFVEGVTLADIIDAEAPLEQDRTAVLSRQLAQGLAHAHEHGLVHRDFKTDNVIVVRPDDVETPKIVDFGLAVLPEASEARDRLTTAGLVMGTPAYMAPEQSTGRAVDHRSDLFSLGLVMYEMLAGMLPFDGAPVHLARQNAMTTPPRINERNPNITVDPRLELIIFKLMAKDPEGRYGDAQEVVAAIDRLYGDDGETPRRPGSGVVPQLKTEPPIEVGPTAAAPLQPHAPSHRARWPLNAMLLAALGAGATAAILLLGGGDRTARDADAPRSAIAAADAAPRPVPVVATIDGETDAGATAPTAATEADASPPPAEKEVRAAKKLPRRKPATKPREVTVEKFRASYRSVGALVDRLEREKGATAAAPFRKRYLSIPYLDALRVPTLRKEGYATLKSVQRGAGKALKK